MMEDKLKPQEVPVKDSKPGPDGPSKFTDEKIKELTNNLKNYTAQTEFPIWSEFCFKNDIHRCCRRELCERSVEFSDSFEKMMSKQDSFLNKAGISKKSNPSFVKFLLINNHKKDDGTPYRDKQDHELSGPGGVPLAPPQIVFTDKEDCKDVPK